MAKANFEAYLQTITREIIAQGDRVRQLIGDRHWLSDGTHKEAVVCAVLSRFLPSSVTASKGFVLGTHDGTICSKEQDILIYDTTSNAPLFDQSGLTILMGRQALATASIKSTLNHSSLWGSLDNQLSAHLAALQDGNLGMLSLALFFDLHEDFRDKPERITEAIAKWFEKEYPGKQDGTRPMRPYLVCLPDLVFRCDVVEPYRLSVKGYTCPHLAGASLVAALAERLDTYFGGSRSAMADAVSTMSFAAHYNSPITANLK